MLDVIWDGLMRYLISILAFPRCDLLCHDMHEFGLHWSAVRQWNNTFLNFAMNPIHTSLRTGLS